MDFCTNLGHLIESIPGLGAATRPRVGTLTVQQRQLRWLLDEGHMTWTTPLSFWWQGTYSQFMLVQWGNRMKKDHTHTYYIYIHIYIHYVYVYSYLYTMCVYVYICMYIDKIWQYDKPSTSHSEAALTGMISPHWRLYVPVVLMIFPSVLAEHQTSFITIFSNWSLNFSLNSCFNHNFYHER